MCTILTVEITEFQDEMNNVYCGTYKSALEANVSVHDGASSQEANANELPVTSKG